LLLVLAAGCTPAAGPAFGTGGEPAPVWAVEGWYQDYFTATWEACGEPDEYLPWEPYADEYAGEPNTMLVTEACQEALLADLKVDWDAVAGLEDSRIEASTINAWVSAYTLLSWPLGSVDELRSHTDAESTYWLREPVIGELERLSLVTGETRVRRLVYNLVMSLVRANRLP